VHTANHHFHARNEAQRITKISSSIAAAAVGEKACHRTMSNHEEIKAVAPAIIELHLSENEVSQSINQSVENSNK